MASRAFDRQVHDDLLDLTGINFDTSEVRTGVDDQFHILANQAPQEVAHVADQFVQVQHPGLQDLLAAEGQQLPGEHGGAIGGFLNLFQLFVLDLGQTLNVFQQLAVADDHCQYVVEVVGDTARQAPHRFEPLG